MSRREGSSDSTTPSSSTAAVCTTPPTECRDSNDSSAGRSETSHASTITSAPSSRNADTSAVPVRETSSSSRTPCSATRCRATSCPRPPVPPVISTRPDHVSRSAGSAARASRAASTTPSRIASTGSSVVNACSTAPAEASAKSRSTSTKRPGCSDWADRTRPRAAAAARSSPSTAPRVTNASRPEGRDTNSWISANTREHVERTSVPATGTSVRSASVSSETTGPAASDSTSGPSTATVCSANPAGSSTGAHSTRNNESRPVPASSSSTGTGRVCRASTDATGAPVASATAISIEPSSPRDSRTRTAEAPEACRDTPCQENGSPPRLIDPRSPNPAACMPASSNAGCSPNAPPSTPSGSATSAYTTPSPPRHTARRPWKTGP